MPGLNGTGPLGEGPMTGGRIGFLGRGLGAGRGYSRGRFPGCRLLQRRLPKKEELEILKEDAEILKEDLEATNERIKELGK
ncbi:MAG: DUF5320 domain-containing protein [Patescibacteria group bacterium]|nr:DUF5320 domain-containing protein [Patescibacteria group bacterium]